MTPGDWLAMLASVDIMTPGGWFVMVASVGSVTALLIWCLYKVAVTSGSTEHLHSQADFDTPDVEEDDP